ncbi:MAG: asparagine synthase (glutamine-hydrolyzing) [Alphaproteobacteria bacterium]
MCGIAGIATKNSKTPDDKVLLSLKNALSHRGPDGSGQFKAEGIGLVQTRLSIIDLAGGSQPIYETVPNGAVIVANGEIYNYLELKKDFPDYQFSTNSDCELPLALWRKYGTDLTKYLRGMYSFAIWDKDTLVIARDEFGIKPLYYAETDKGFVFASEPKAIIATGLVGNNINDEVTLELMQLQFTTGRKTVFNDIKRLLPGELLVIKNGEIQSSTVNNIFPEKVVADLSEEEALLKLDEILLESVEFHQRADVPFGMFLSGGIDSTSLLWLMSQLNDTPVQAFTAGFPKTSVHDEREQAKLITSIVGAKHEEIEITSKDFFDILPSVVNAMDDPCADYATIPTFMLAKKAGSSLKVILSGEGGDEIFGGYGRYRSAIRPLFAKQMRRKGTFNGLENLFKKEHQLFLDKTWRQGFAASERYVSDKHFSKLQKVQAIDCQDWLPNDLLNKLDRCLMRNAVEGRVPFLDKNVLNFAFSLPDNLKIKRGKGKWLLRKWLNDRLPQADAFAHKKGFTVPVFDWIFTEKDRLGKLVAEQDGINKLFEPKAVQELFANTDRKNGFVLWSVLFYALWHKIHLQGAECQQDVFGVLADSH